MNRTSAGETTEQAVRYTNARVPTGQAARYRSVRAPNGIGQAVNRSVEALNTQAQGRNAAA